MKITRSVELWFSKAADDILWAKSSYRDGVYYGACFICQQAAEKAIKAFLLANGKIIRKIHDLSALTEECFLIDASFEEIRETVLPLVDYYLETRYPDMGDFIGYTQEKAEDAIKRAEKVMAFAGEKLFPIVK